MAIDREILRQVEHRIRPLSTRTTNMIARAVVRLVDDTPKLQALQISAPETIPDGEHFQPYGFSSVPLTGAEGVALFPSGDRGHPLVIVVTDRRYRPTGGEPGEVTVYNHTGAKVVLTRDGDIVATPAAGREVLINDGGAMDRLVKRSEFLAHGHATAATGPVSPPTAAAPLPDTGQFPGTQRLRSQ